MGSTIHLSRAGVKPTTVQLGETLVLLMFAPMNNMASKTLEYERYHALMQQLMAERGLKDVGDVAPLLGISPDYARKLFRGDRTSVGLDVLRRAMEGPLRISPAYFMAQYKGYRRYQEFQLRPEDVGSPHSSSSELEDLRRRIAVIEKRKGKMS